MNTYEVEIPLDLSVPDSVDAAKLAVVETVARSIVSTSDSCGSDCLLVGVDAVSLYSSGTST
jgi:hypothetical protein